MARWSFPRSVALGALCTALLGAATPAPPIDFANYGPYPAPPCSIDNERPPGFALAGGVYSWADSAGDAGVDIQLRSADFGHLRGDASTQAAVLLGCDYPNPGFFNQWVDVFDVRGPGAATFVASVAAGDEEAPTQSARIVGDRLVVVTDTKKIYALRGGLLVPATQ
jgi:hypothetical protein